ncbi:hypothetical protein P7C70_g5768, partial [Phenoliferia sp. Uapishka_3]
MPSLSSPPSQSSLRQLPPLAAAAQSPNTFTFYLSKLHRKSDFDFILAGIFSVLQQSLSQPLLPVVGPATGQKGKSGWATETIIVLWRMIELNPKFLAHILDSEHDAGDLAVYLLTLCLEHKDDEAQLGLVRLCAFFLQRLSAEAKFGPKLNSPVRLKLGVLAKYAVPGTLGDFFIVSIHSLIFTTRAKLSSLYPAFVLAIANTSPYLKELSALASGRLNSLFLAFSAPSFLLMEEGNPRLAFYLLETYNHIIHYQLSDNPHLIYAIIRSHQRFSDLSNFTLASGVASVRRARLERKAALASPPLVSTPRRTSSQSARGDGKSEGEENAEGEVPSEKAMGKRRERSLSDATLMGVEASEASEGEVFVGKHGFVPTESWLRSALMIRLSHSLPLDTIQIMLAELRTKVLELGPTPETNGPAIAFLRSASLVGLLPPPPPLRPRTFITTPQSLTWLASLVYGSIYLGSLELLRDVPVSLFAVAQAARRGARLDLVNGAMSVAQFVMSKVASRGGA